MKERGLVSWVATGQFLLWGMAGAQEEPSKAPKGKVAEGKTGLSFVIFKGET